MKKELAAMLEKKNSQSKLEKKELVIISDSISEFADNEEFEPAFYLQRFLDFQRAGYQYGWKWIEKFLAYVTREERKRSRFQVSR
ncbi:hypothetical protein OQZ55_00180 [Bacillus subtilis]|uniref:hypothetical protein n=1 Tax=Bacillus subtilis TaxID=1423 RepID=UPI00203A5AB4|nr:hypothetical protein [Bacillus subtilis]MCM3191436.1 hypothetical protein [Bacillus subtilis]MCX4074732.1 hypothetical protein [Bacillus subtilis]MEC0395673.1 hypothetical protein [Bacillus subtilis]WBC28221.1 hypothetical protein O6U12_22375 [Bacillus subtilis]